MAVYTLKIRSRRDGKERKVNLTFLGRPSNFVNPPPLPPPPYITATNITMSPIPNILITGTPGTGKTTFSQMLVETLAPLSSKFKVVNVGDVVKAEGAHSGWNAEWDAWDVDEDKVS